MPPVAPAASALVLTAQNLQVTYQVATASVPVLRDISLSTTPGEKVFLCGPSGAGKTTLLYVLGGLEKPTSGRVLLTSVADNNDTNTSLSLYEMSNGALADKRNTAFGYVFQNYLLLPELTALENVALPSMIGRRLAKSRAAELLAAVGLGNRIKHLPRELSGGEQQRVAIARALINDPQIIFADEPTGNLDSKTSGEVMNLLLSVVAESQKTLMVVTHDARLAQLGDRILTLRDGMLES